MQSKTFALLRACSTPHPRAGEVAGALAGAQDRLVQTEKLAPLGRTRPPASHTKSRTRSIRQQSFGGLRRDSDELRRRLLEPTSTTSCEQRLVRSPEMLEGNLRQSRAARQARRTHRQEHATAFASGFRGASARRYNALVEEESLEPAIMGARREDFGTTSARSRFAAAGEPTYPAGDYAGAPESDSERLLRGDQA